MQSKLLKFGSATIVAAFLLQPIGQSAGQVKASTIENSNEQMTAEEYIKYKEAWIKAIDEMPESDFKDPSAKQDMKNSIAKSEERGKATLAAKAAAKSIKAVMKKVGKKGWNKLVKKVESTTGTELVALHYESITGLLNLLANSQEKATTVISKYLRQNAGLNKATADAVAATFVTIVL